MLSKQDQNVPMSQQLQQNAQGYLQQGMQPATASPLTQPQMDTQGNPVPVTQQSFSGVTPMSGDIPQYTGGQQYVPGVGYLGADLGGAVKGTMLRQQYALNAAENNRAEETIGIAKTKLAQDQDYLNIAKTTTGMRLNQASMETKSFERQQALQAGMELAAKEGGFDAVVDYLKTADPTMAMQFGSLKANLDKSIMENETYKTAHQFDKQQAMLGGYQMLGSLGATLLNAPPEQRAALWEQMQPIAKQIDPSISKKLDDSVIAKLGMGMSLSTPANVLYNGAKSAIEYQSATGKLVGDIRQATAKFGADSFEVKTLQTDLNNKQQAAEKNNLQMASTIAQNQQTGESGLRSQWLAFSKDMGTIFKANESIRAAVNAIGEDGKTKGPDDMAIIYNYQKMLDPTTGVMPADYESAKKSGSWSDASLVAYKQVLDGDLLAPEVRQSFLDAAERLYQIKAQSYYVQKSQFQDIARRNNYNPDNILIDAAPQKPTQAAKDYLLKDPSPEMRIKYQLVFGQDALNEALGEAQQQGQANGQ